MVLPPKGSTLNSPNPVTDYRYKIDVLFSQLPVMGEAKRRQKQDPTFGTLEGQRLQYRKELIKNLQGNAAALSMAIECLKSGDVLLEAPDNASGKVSTWQVVPREKYLELSKRNGEEESFHTFEQEHPGTLFVLSIPRLGCGYSMFFAVRREELNLPQECPLFLARNTAE